MFLAERCEHVGQRCNAYGGLRLRWVYKDINPGYGTVSRNATINLADLKKISLSLEIYYHAGEPRRMVEPAVFEFFRDSFLKHCLAGGENEIPLSRSAL